MKDYTLNMIKKDTQNVRYYLEQLNVALDDNTRNSEFNSIEAYARKGDFGMVEMILNELPLEEDYEI